ncbi:MAG: methyltransferase domain-containing protein [Actinomycetia bacterium]|nr:methyltransferase domain-containing protein [Actinomycetes bacterium]
MMVESRLRCPNCASAGQPSAGSGAERLGERDNQGELVCETCNASYPVVDGIPHIHLDDHTWRSKKAESAGWEALSAELGQLHYEGIGAPPVDFKIPYIPHEPWATFGRGFDKLFGDLEIGGADTLDIGAGRPWAAKQFALRGARSATAVDVNPHPVVGLGRGWEMAAEAGVHLELLVGDSERLPLADNSMDICFISAALHHSNFIRNLTSEMARVLRPGGVAVVANEPTRAAFEDESTVLNEVAQLELRHGITERRPTAAEYLEAMLAAGFDIEQVHLGPDCRDSAIWTRLKAPALTPPRQDWASIKTPVRIARAIRTRWRLWPFEHRLRKVLPRSSSGARSSHAEMISLVYGRPDINIVARVAK